MQVKESEIIECNECRYLARDVRVNVMDRKETRPVAHRDFDFFCIKRFEPCWHSGVLIGCSDGEKRRSGRVDG